MFRDAGLTESAVTFYWVALTTAGLVTLGLLAVGVSQPDIFGRSLFSIVIVDLMVIATIVVNRAGFPRAASVTYLTVIIALITYSAFTAGGIRSPGTQAWFVFVLLAGLLLGHRAGAWTAVVCVLAGLGLVLAEHRGMIDSAGVVTYSPVARWLITSMYIGIALLTLRAATSRVQKALAKAQAELRERQAAEQRLYRALDAGKIGTFDLDLRSGMFSADDRALQITGFASAPAGRVSLDDWFQRVHPDDRPAITAQLDAFRSGSREGRSRYRLQLPSGELRYLESAASLITDEAGQPQSVLGMISDVTDRQRSMEERERLLLDLGERVKELRLLHDAARLLQQATAIDRLLLADLVKRIPQAWLHGDDACARIGYRDIVVTSAGWQESPWRQRADFSTSDGDGYIEVGYRREHAILDEGPFLAEERALLNSLAELLRTHTEQQVIHHQRQGLEAQLRQAQRLDALGTLAGGIAHDFNNILTAIGGHAQLATLEAGEQGPVAESIKEILRAHGRARDLVRRILLFSRQEEVAATREVLAPQSVVDEAVELLRASLPKNVEITVEVEPNLPTVLADATQIHQVVMNLGTNAGYAMKARGGRLSIGLDTVDVVDEATAPSADLAPGKYVRISVRDTGTGMSREVMERLFEPFFTTKGNAGTGLGLSVVHGIIREHGGAITLASELGVGTEFRIYLPVRTGSTERQAPKVGLIRGRGEHIMYVDDEPSLTMVISRTLRHIGYRCTEFTDADLALHEFRTAPDAFDAVITDLQMPTMTGIELIRALRAIRPDLPAAVASGYTPARHADAESQSLTWISKPATLEELSAAVHQLVSGKR